MSNNRLGLADSPNDSSASSHELPTDGDHISEHTMRVDDDDDDDDDDGGEGAEELADSLLGDELTDDSLTRFEELDDTGSLDEDQFEDQYEDEIEEQLENEHQMPGYANFEDREQDRQRRLLRNAGPGQQVGLNHPRDGTLDSDDDDDDGQPDAFNQNEDMDYIPVLQNHPGQNRNGMPNLAGLPPGLGDEIRETLGDALGGALFDALGGGAMGGPFDNEADQEDEGAPAQSTRQGPEGRPGRNGRNRPRREARNHSVDEFVSEWFNQTYGVNETGNIPHILHALRSSDDAIVKDGLIRLSEVLMGHGSAASLVPLDAVARTLVPVLQRNESVEIQIMVARGMTQLIDVREIRGALGALVNAGAVPVIKQRLENVFYIDLIEQLVHLLLPIAALEPHLVLTSDCLLPCLNSFDFFDRPIQAQILVSVAKLAPAIERNTLDHAQQLVAAFPRPLVTRTTPAYAALVARMAPIVDTDTLVNDEVWAALLEFASLQPREAVALMRAVASVVTQHPERVVAPMVLAKSIRDVLAPGIAPAGDGARNRHNQHLAALAATRHDGMSVVKPALGGIELLRTLLPAAPPVGAWVGPFREPSRPRVVDLGDKIAFANYVTPYVMATHTAYEDIETRRACADVVVRITSMIAKESLEDLEEFAVELGLAEFASTMVSEPKDASIVVGGLDVLWELARTPILLPSLNIANSIQNGANNGEANNNAGNNNAGNNAGNNNEKTDEANTPSEPDEVYTPQSNLHPVLAYMSGVLVPQLEARAESSASLAAELIADLRNGGLYDSRRVESVPTAVLLKAGLLEALEGADPKKIFSEGLVRMLLGILKRLDKLEDGPERVYARSYDELFSHMVRLRISEHPGSPTRRTWEVTIPAVASMSSINEFVKVRLGEDGTNRAPASSAAVRSANRPAGRRSPVEFYAAGTKLPLDISILKAISGQRGVPVITYKKLPQRDSDEAGDHTEDEDEAEEEEQAEEDADGTDENGYSLSIPPPLSQILRVLRRLFIENERRGEQIPRTAFESQHLETRMRRELENLLALAASMLPQWIFDTVRRFPFLYSLEARLKFMRATSFGLGHYRRLHEMQVEHMPDFEILGTTGDLETEAGRTRRIRFRVRRDEFRESAVRVLEQSAESPAVVEVTYAGEIGTGKGPTQEFFSLASRAMVAPELDMWVESGAGLYPQPNFSPSPAVLRYFRAVGMLIARALLDDRLLDFQLSPAFFEAVLGPRQPSLDKLRHADPQIAAALERVSAASPADIEAMDLDFVMPGTTVDLLPAGASIRVTAANAANYVRLVTDRLVGSGISQQMEACAAGIARTLSLSALRPFSYGELAALCGAERQEDWSVERLRTVIRADHGYGLSDNTVKYLFSVLSELTPSERRRFLTFTTGSPVLPLGGFEALVPQMTIALQRPDNDEISTDRYLPSVMTCAHYVKIPPYSSAEVLRRQLFLAIREGSHSFPLS